MSIREQAIRRMMAEEAARAVPMSKSDQVVITQSQADVPGVYVSSDQKQQDAYAAMIANTGDGYGMQSYPPYFASQQAADMNGVVKPVFNPNYQVVDPTTMTADSKGNIIIY